MNRFDIEFWNGSLKSTILIKKEIEKLLDVCNENEKEGIKIALRRISEIKSDIENVHGNTILRALRNLGED